MSTTIAATMLTLQSHRWTAAELRKLPAAQRDAILAAAAELAEADYQSDRALIGFEAFGKEVGCNKPLRSQAGYRYRNST